MHLVIRICTIVVGHIIGHTVLKIVIWPKLLVICIQNLRVSLIVMSKWPITYNQHMTNVWYMINTWPILNRICKSLLRELVTLRIFYIIIPATNKQHRTDGFGLHHVSCWGGSSWPPTIAYVCPRLTSATWQGPNSLLSVKISASGAPPSLRK